MTYAFIRIRSEDRVWLPMYRRLSSDDFATLKPARLWGAFSGLFGIASNELFLVTAGEGEAASGSIDALAQSPGIRVTDSLLLEPTLRPTSDEPRTREGLYVFRLFDVAQRDVEEIAQLSGKAWETFETAGSYASEPQGLWREHDRSSERGRMLLLTWYDGLSSWQTSRSPPPEAREYFRRRHERITSHVGYATRLITTRG